MQFFRRQLVYFRQKFPAPQDRFLLEIISEGKISQHFKEGMMPGRVAHIFKIVVLSPGSDTLLGSCRSGVP